MVEEFKRNLSVCSDEEELSCVGEAKTDQTLHNLFFTQSNFAKTHDKIPQINFFKCEFQWKFVTEATFKFIAGYFLHIFITSVSDKQSVIMKNAWTFINKRKVTWVDTSRQTVR